MQARDTKGLAHGAWRLLHLLRPWGDGGTLYNFSAARKAVGSPVCTAGSSVGITRSSNSQSRLGCSSGHQFASAPLQDAAATVASLEAMP